MRFITEFELDGMIDAKKLDYLVPDKKHIRELGIGREIGRAFGWNEKGQTTLQGPVIHQFSLEIEAFPMDKWLEFKKKLLMEILHSESINRESIINELEKLESFQCQTTK